jgi:hypothetical protein
MVFRVSGVGVGFGCEGSLAFIPRSWERWAGLEEGLYRRWATNEGGRCCEAS